MNALKFSDFNEFLEHTADQDRQFLRSGELHKIPETVCALSNSLGGWIILGAELDEREQIIISGLPENFRFFRSDSQIFNSPAKVIIFHVDPLKFYDSPKLLNNKVYRRVEGINLISGKFAKSVIASDSLEFSRDDFPTKNISLNKQYLQVFRKSVENVRPEYKFLSHDEFLRRSFIYSGKYLTFAGALMFGDVLEIRAELHHAKKISLTAKNIWSAYNYILPRLTQKLSERCAAALREIFVNALLHSDYNIDSRINITITSGPPKILIDNPGKIRELPRNQRLQKIFSLMGVRTDGLDWIKLYSPSFMLRQDMLNFRVRASLNLEAQKIILL